MAKNRLPEVTVNLTPLPPKGVRIVFVHYEGRLRMLSTRKTGLLGPPYRPNCQTRLNCKAAISLGREIKAQDGIPHTISMMDKESVMEDYFHIAFRDLLDKYKAALKPFVADTRPAGAMAFSPIETVVNQLWEDIEKKVITGVGPIYIYIVASKRAAAKIATTLKSRTKNDISLKGADIKIETVPTSLGLVKKFLDLIRWPF